MSDLQSLAEKSLWKIEEGLGVLPDCINEGAKLIGADSGDVKLALSMGEAIKAQVANLHLHLAATAVRAGSQVPQPRSGGGGKPPPP